MPEYVCDWLKLQVVYMKKMQEVHYLKNHLFHLK